MKIPVSKMTVMVRKGRKVTNSPPMPARGRNIWELKIGILQFHSKLSTLEVEPGFPPYLKESSRGCWCPLRSETLQ